MHYLYLASSSPRRREILKNRNIHFDTLPLKVSEIPNENLNPLDQIRQISALKLRTAQIEIKQATRANQPYVLLCADTEVIFEGKLLGKPASLAFAEKTLGRLSGKTHQVTTVIQLFESSQSETLELSVTTQIQFNQLTLEDIQGYVQTGDPMDKAGSYGIQNVPKHFIRSVEGSFENVIGLPIDELMKLFEKKNWEFLPFSIEPRS